jgi:hypothetical protein
MAMSIIFMIVGLLFYLVMLVGVQILCTFGLWRMANHAGVPHAWLAFLPVGNAYVTGMLAERAIYTYTGKRSRLALWTPALQGIALMGLMMVAGLIIIDSDFNAFVALALLILFAGSILGTILYFYAIYYVFKDYAPDNATLYTILGILFGIYWIFQLVEMNTVPVSVTGFGPWPGSRPKYNRTHQWSPTQPPAGYPGQPYPGGPYATNPTQPPYQGGTYTTTPAQPPYQGGTYTTTPAHPPYQGQGPQFYQGQGSSYPQQPPAQRPRDEGENNGPELK